MQYIRRSEERGAANFGWLSSKHSFSFGNYYDPAHMGISALRVINDDAVAPAAGFDTHGHKNMEIISYVLEGIIEHKDSTGNHYQIPAGDVQRMSAGRGVTHSEFNASKDKPLKFLQIWIQPNEMDIEPEYEQRAIEQTSALTTLVSPSGEGDALSIHQNAKISRLRLNAGETYALTSSGENAYLHVVSGGLKLVSGASANGSLSEGDAIGGQIKQGETLEVAATPKGVEALWFELP